MIEKSKKYICLFIDIHFNELTVKKFCSNDSG